MTEHARKLLSVEGLTVNYRTPRSAAFTALDGVGLELAAGEVVAVVGESGSGKSTLGRAIMGTLAHNAAVRKGRVLFDGVDLLTLDPTARRRLRGSSRSKPSPGSP
jgi:ABC-type glutathione transport system ATPase component